MSNGSEITDGHKQEQTHKSKLVRYEIPIDHLSYEYIRGCKDVKELEKIVKILKSGEEGCFPDLQKTAEERLLSLSPNNRLLRTEAPALNKRCFNISEWRNILDGIENWKKEVSVRDKQLVDEVNEGDGKVMSLPPVRQPLLAKQSSDSTQIKVTPKKKTSDYSFWDKYDVDTELLKLDLIEEQKKVKVENERLTNQTGKDRSELVNEAEKCSETEKKILAEQEKIRGNEYYQANDFEEATKYYTASLAIYPTAKAYNNRASCYLKQYNYPAAIEDADNTLKLEPNNIKALFRKGIALKHLNKYQEALENISIILRLEPSNVQAENLAKQLTEKINAGMMKKSYLDPGKTNQVKTGSSSISGAVSYAESNHHVEVNEWGLPKTSCSCAGDLRSNILVEHPSSKLPSLHERRQPVESKPGNVRIVELSDENKLPQRKPPTKLEIIEIETSTHEPPKDLCRPKKCKVVDRRNQKTDFGHGGGDVM